MAERDGRRRLGKLTSLGWLLLAHGAALEADFQQFYGLELGACSPRRAWVLAQHLPREARVTRAIDEEATWGAQEHLLANVVDLLQLSNWLYIAAHTGEKGRPPKKPEPLRRPGEQKQNKQIASGGKALSSLLGR